MHICLKRAQKYFGGYTISKLNSGYFWKYNGGVKKTHFLLYGYNIYYMLYKYFIT